MTIGMFNSFITGHWFDAEAKQVWSDRSQLQAWLDVEAALAAVQAGLGLIPAEAAATIAQCADADHFDLAELGREIAFAAHPLTPVLRRFEALCGEPAAGFIHWGATTQNIFDTATALQMRQTHRLLSAHLEAACQALGRLALLHRETPMAGRTHGQQALPMSLGFKLSGWLDELARCRDRLGARLAPSFPVSMGGAIGTYAAMGPLGPEVELRLAKRLGLQSGGLPLRCSYDRAADYVQSLGLLAGTAQRIAQDVVFMQRTEVGEMAEAFHDGKVGSSTMAHKRNPSTALLLVSLARLLRLRMPAVLEAMVRSDEGDSSSTNVTDTLIPEVAVLAVSVAAQLRRLAEGLVVNAAAMRRNLDLTRGLIVSEAVMMKLAPVLGRHEAHKVLYEAAQEVLDGDRSLLDAVLSHPAVAASEIPQGLAAALEPSAYLGLSSELTSATVEHVLGSR